MTTRIYGFFDHPDPLEEGRALAVAEDGRIVASHFCSGENWAASDLGMTPQSTRHHRDYAKACPDGWVLEYVPHRELGTDDRLRAALQRYEQRNRQQGGPT